MERSIAAFFPVCLCFLKTASNICLRNRNWEWSVQVVLLFSSNLCPQVRSCELCPCGVKRKSKSRHEHSRLLSTSIVHLHYWLLAKGLLRLIAFKLYTAKTKRIICKDSSRSVLGLTFALSIQRAWAEVEKRLFIWRGSLFQSVSLWQQERCSKF